MQNCRVWNSQAVSPKFKSKLIFLFSSYTNESYTVIPSSGVALSGTKTENRYDSGNNKTDVLNVFVRELLRSHEHS